MAKATANIGDVAQALHTRTTLGADESQTVVLGIDGSDSIVPVDDTRGLRVQPTPSLLAVTATGIAGAAVTATLPAPAVGLFQYLTLFRLALYSTAARTGIATPIVATTTNLPGSPAFVFDTAGAIGTVIRAELVVAASPLRAAAAATAVTIVAPAVVGGLWRLNAFYYTGP